jgi:hypothetical protein
MMSTVAGRESGRTWLLAAAGALLVLLAVASLFRFPASAGLGSPAFPRAEMAISAAGVSFHDPTPLFLPTEWNARPNTRSRGIAGDPTDDSRYGAPQLLFPVNATKLAFPSRVEVPEKPVDALKLWVGEDPFLGMGQKDVPMVALPRRTALVEVVTADGGRQVLTQALTDARPPGNGDWPPMEFLVAVEPAGLIGLPALIPGSTPADVAAYFQNYLAKVLRVGERLAPGFYRVKVGP